jgi:hypothetical protein
MVKTYPPGNGTGFLSWVVALAGVPLQGLPLIEEATRFALSRREVSTVLLGPDRYEYLDNALRAAAGRLYLPAF